MKLRLPSKLPFRNRPRIQAAHSVQHHTTPYVTRAHPPAPLKNRQTEYVRTQEHLTRMRVDVQRGQWAEVVEDAANGNAKSPLRVHLVGPTIKTTEDMRRSSKIYRPILLRDNCTCPRCVDPSTTQKLIRTTDIPLDIGIKSINLTPEGMDLSWKNDIPGFDDDHITHIPLSFLSADLISSSLAYRNQRQSRKLWARQQAEALPQIPYVDYIHNDQVLLSALKQLEDYGILILSGVPEDQKSVVDIAERIGTLRDTFYGRTWDVKSVPQAKNVAYTPQFLGLHMDLLYMENPPGFQFLHCLQNSCEGGSSLFSDSFKALYSATWNHLRQVEVVYHYNNDGHHYERKVPFLKTTGKTTNFPEVDSIEYVNYSPPFQAPFQLGAMSSDLFAQGLSALRKFASAAESEENLFEYRMKEGDCVIFNNRRVLHGRREFDSTSGQRWLKGCYVDTDVFQSRLRVLSAALDPARESETNIAKEEVAS